jgi:hypothetical protein
MIIGEPGANKKGVNQSGYGGIRMDAIDVTARFNLQGEVIPIRFNWNGVDYLVESTGRSWDDGEGRHVLVMAPGGQTFELILALPACRWYVMKIGINPGRAAL